MTMDQFFGGIDDTAPRDFSTEMHDIRGQAKSWLGMAQKGDTQAARNQMGVEGDFYQQVLASYPELARREREATSAQRNQDATDLGYSGRKMQNILEGMAPELKTAGGALATLLSQVGQQTPLLKKLNTDAMGEGISPINQKLQDMALSELRLGGDLSPDEQRQIQQNARAGYSARGTLGGDLSTIDEIMGLSTARTARERERMGMAQAVNRDWLDEVGRDRGFQTTVEGLNQQRTQQDRAFVPAAIGAGAARLSPMLSIFGQRSATNPLAAGQLYGMAPNATGSSNQSLGQIMGYGQDLYNTNFNADWSKQVMETNNAVALHKSMDEAISTMVGGAMGGACWVAREILGTATDAWKRVRAWLLTKAPAWFRAFYLVRGPQWAERLRTAGGQAERAALGAMFNQILEEA